MKIVENIFTRLLAAVTYSTLFLSLPRGFVSGLTFSTGSGTTINSQKTLRSKYVLSPSSLVVNSAAKMRKSTAILASSADGIDPVLLQGIAIGVAGLVAGIGLVAFTEGQGERSKQRGGGLSDNMSTRIAGKLIEDVEIKSDLSSLTGQLEKALMETGAAKEEDLAISEETKKKIKEQSDEGW